MGRWVVSIIVIGALIIGVTFFLVKKPEIPQNAPVLPEKVKSFSMDIRSEAIYFPKNIRLKRSDSWAFDLQGNQITVTSPGLEKVIVQMGKDKKGRPKVVSEKFEKLTPDEWKISRDSIRGSVEQWMSRQTTGESNSYTLKLIIPGEPIVTQ